jgi:2-methylcitrate dehydratase PrpD
MISFEDVACVEVHLPAEVIKIICEPVDNKRRPQNDYDARFSIQFLVAAALTRGRITLAELEPEALRDPTILNLADRVNYAIDSKSSFPSAYSGEVVLRLRNGGEKRHREDINRGAADRPLSADDIVRKFFENTAISVGIQKAIMVKEAVLGLDQAAPVSVLADRLAG